VITIWLTATKYPYLKWQWIFYFYVDVFFLYHCHYFYRTLLYIWVTWRVSYKKHVLLTLCKHPSSLLVFWWGPCCSFFQFSCVVLLCVFTFWVSFCDIRYDFCIKRCSVSFSPPGVCKGARVLFTLFVFACSYWCPTHTFVLYCVFVLFFFVLCALWCQCLWIVHYWLPLRCSIVNVYLTIKTSASPEVCIVEHPYLNNI